MRILGDLKKLDTEAAASTFAELIQSKAQELGLPQDVVVLYDQPVMRVSEGEGFRAKFLIFSKKHGIVLMDCLAITERVTEVLLTQGGKLFDDLYGHVQAKLVRSGTLRKAKLNVAAGVYVLNASETYTRERIARHYPSDYSILMSTTDLMTFLKEGESGSDYSNEILAEARSALTGLSGAFEKPRRTAVDSDQNRKGAILDSLEGQIANFDADQQDSASKISFKPERIRGLAGSGKTVILAWKAAQIHALYPEKKILYTYYTKSLHEHITRLIKKFFKEFSEAEPNWDNLQVMHGWGGAYLQGAYHSACKENGRRALSFSDAQARNRNSPFDAACQDLLENAYVQPKYEYVLIDEGQDFPAYFFKLCLQLCVGKNIVWAFDECQNILNVKTQSATALFATEDLRLKLITDEELEDSILHNCYRNPREVIFCAFGYGMGLFNQPIIQMPESAEHWSDLGFKVLSGDYKTGSMMKIERPLETTPHSKVLNQSLEQIVRVRPQEDFFAEIEFIATQIANDLAEGLRPQDILVVSLDDRYTPSYFNRITLRLFDLGIQTFNLQDADSQNIRFTRDNCVTLSTVYKAKGNEAASVYVVGIDNAYNGINRNDIRERNKVFTAMTRSKAWLTISGIGDGAKRFEEEMNTIIAAFPSYEFLMPDLHSLQTLQRTVKKQNKELLDLRRRLKQLSKETKMSMDEAWTLLKESDLEPPEK